MQDSVTFLGHKLKRGSVEPEQDKLEKTKELQTPRTQTELKTVISLFNFFQGFLPNYTLHSAKLTALTCTNNT